MMNIPEAFRPFFNDHTLHLLQMRDTKDLKFQNQDNQDFFTLISEFYNNNGKININDWKEKYSDWNIYWETMAAFGAATRTPELIHYALKKEGGIVNMCTALENLKKEGIQEGEIRGMIVAYKEMNVDETMIIAKLKERFHLSNEEIIFE